MVDTSDTARFTSTYYGERVCVFHATDPFRQGRTVLGNPDLRGDTTFVYRIIEAARSDSVFVDYYWDDPDNPNDDVEGTLRTTYGNIVKVPPGIFPGNPDLVVAGSFFPSISTAVEDEIGEILRSSCSMGTTRTRSIRQHGSSLIFLRGRR